MHRRSSKRFATLAALAALAIVAIPPARGEETKPTIRERMAQFHRDWVAAGRPPSPSPSLVPKFGVDSYDAVNVHAYSFLAHTSSNLIVDDGNGYRYFAAPAVPVMAAPVTLPSGVHIEAIGMSFCSANAGDLVMGIWDNGEGGGGSGGGTMVAGPIFSVQGCGVVGDNTDYLYTQNEGHPLYIAVFFAASAPTDGTTKFNNVKIRYRRRVSPSPAVATFSDVSASDFGFQYIEALAASGITGGCSEENYCPDDPVTRRQMAIFIARALGLHWPQ